MTAIETKTTKRRSRPILRKFEASIGLPLADLFGKWELKNSKLVGPKKVFLPKSRIHLNYFEREAVPILSGGEESSKKQQHDVPTLLLLHGIGSSSEEFLSFLRFMNIPPHIRILIPDHVGQGEDLKRAFSEGPSFQQPDANTLLETTSEFLDMVNAGPNCNALGTSLGGALLYFLKAKRPDVIQKTVLFAPALPHCLTEKFLGGLLEGKHGFMDFRSREDVKQLFRNFLWTDPQKRSAGAIKQKKRREKKDPFPKIAYEVIYRLTLRNVPEGHYRALQDKLLVTSGTNNGSNDGDNNKNEFAVTTDVDPNSERLVVWPEEDQICSLKQGKDFFAPSIANGTTILQTIPNCGHVFHGDGRGMYEVVTPMVKNFLLDFSQGKHEPVVPTKPQPAAFSTASPHCAEASC